jgi:hypothetical protein
MTVTLAKPTDARERVIAAYVQRTGLSDYFARQHYADARRWAERLTPAQRAAAHSRNLLTAAPMCQLVIVEVMHEREELVVLDKIARRFTIAYTHRETVGFEIRRILPGVVRVGEDSNRPWVELRDSGLEWFPVTAVSARDALTKGRAELGDELAALWDQIGVEMDDSPATDAYFRTVLVTANLA